MFKKTSLLLIIIGFLFSCKSVVKEQGKEIQIAFLSDVHLGDIYGVFQDSDYKGILNPETGKYTLARTMQSQLKSTRLFNENYFAFLAALHDVVNRGVNYVVLPGDFSDDGQLVNIRGLKQILTVFSEKYKIQFITTTGNHDPVKPFYQDAGKTDFLGEGGKPQAIFSKKDMFVSKDTSALPTIITKDIAKLGYEGILSELKAFGFFPKKEDIYWETPFTTYTYENYSFSEALKYSDLNFRTYKMPSTEFNVPDVSYLLEPSGNLWFLAIDANVYVPKEKVNDASYDQEDFEGASVGYNHVLTHKEHLLTWIKSITKRAKDLGKTLIVFSHYPTIDFNDDATNEMKALFGEDSMQMHRVPDKEVAKALADSGVKLHFGGHMHINDTGMRHFENGDFLINIQIPSLAAYIPGYKLLTIKDDGILEVETIVLDSVPDFKTLFPLYKQEYGYLSKKKDSTIWDPAILNAESYKAFTEWHLKELVRLRFLKEDWPKEFKKLLIKSTGKELLLSSFNNEEELLAFGKVLKKQHKSIEMFSTWTGLDMINDFYKLKNADVLAIPDIGNKRLDAYKILCNQLKKSDKKDLHLWATIFLKIAHGEPANHFEIDLKSGTIKAIDPLY